MTYCSTYDQWRVPCPCCSIYAYVGASGALPRHTRRVWGIGWGGRPMHLPCPGSGRDKWGLRVR